MDGQQLCTFRPAGQRPAGAGCKALWKAAVSEFPPVNSAALAGEASAGLQLPLLPAPEGKGRGSGSQPRFPFPLAPARPLRPLPLHHLLGRQCQAGERHWVMVGRAGTGTLRLLAAEGAVCPGSPPARDCAGVPKPIPGSAPDTGAALGTLAQGGVHRRAPGIARLEPWPAAVRPRGSSSPSLAAGEFKILLLQTRAASHPTWAVSGRQADTLPAPWLPACPQPAASMAGLRRQRSLLNLGFFFPSMGPFLPLLPPPGLLEGCRRAQLLPACAHTCTRVTRACRSGRSPWAVGAALWEPGAAGTTASPRVGSRLPAGCILLLQQAGVRGAGVPGAGDRQQGGGLARHQAGQGKGAGAGGRRAGVGHTGAAETRMHRSMAQPRRLCSGLGLQPHRRVAVPHLSSSSSPDRVCSVVRSQPGE